MEIDVFNSKFYSLVESLEKSDLDKIYSDLSERDLCERNLSSESDQKNAIKSIVMKVSIEDLEQIDIKPLNELIHDFKATSTSANEFFGEEQEDIEDIRRAGREENKEDLINEANNIVSQRLNDREEIPKDLQKRLSYILAKLNVQFKLSKREISNVIQLNPTTVSKYVSECLFSEPDLIKLWSHSAEAKSISRVETTMARATSDRASALIKDSLSIGDKVRDQFANQAAVRGYNLYNSQGLELLINKSVTLFFELDSIYSVILELENQNQKLRNTVYQLKNRNSQLNTLVYSQNFLESELI